MRSYIIWCDVEGTGRKINPSFGTNDSKLTFKLRIGSARNSVKWVTVVVDVKQLARSERAFFLSVNDQLVHSTTLDASHNVTAEADLESFLQFAMTSRGAKP